MRKIKTQTFTLFTKLSIYTDEHWCLCVSVSVWFDIDVALLCLQTWFQRRANLSISCFWCRCACSVSATPLDSRIYVTCSYVYVFCHVSVFFVQFFQFIQFNSYRDFWWLICNPATSAKTQPSSQSLTSGQEGRSSVPLVRRPPRSHLRVSGQGGRQHLGNTCLFILFLAGARQIKSQT